VKRAVNTSTDAGESNQFFCKLYFAKVFVRIIYYMAIKKPDCCSNKRIDFGRNADISKINNVKQVFRNTPLVRRHDFYSLFGTAQIQVRTADVAGVILAAGLLLPPLLIG